jgi:hypothetical protein
LLGLSLLLLNFIIAFGDDIAQVGHANRYPLLTALAVSVVKIESDPPQIHASHTSSTRVLAFERPRTDRQPSFYFDHPRSAEPFDLKTGTEILVELNDDGVIFADADCPIDLIVHRSASPRTACSTPRVSDNLLKILFIFVCRLPSCP